MDFTGKVVVITGSSSGIGEEIAIQFAQRGAKVVVTGRAENKIRAVVDKCNKVSPSGFKALGIKCDISNDTDLRGFAEKVIHEFGGVDILVNNAGIGTFIPIEAEGNLEKFDDIMKTNLRAPFYLTHLLVPHLIKSKGNIINIGSVMGMHPFETASAYCMAKAALDMFTKCLTIELGPKGVRVNSVNPAATRTPMFATLGLDEEGANKVEERCSADYPLRRIGRVKDVAKMVLFLASEDASFISGLCAQVDGGALQCVTGVSHVSNIAEH